MVNADRLTHRTFLAGTIFKGMDGCLGLIGAITLFLTTRPEIQHAVAWLTREEQAEDPSDFYATHAVRMAQHLTAGTQHFAAVYLSCTTPSSCHSWRACYAACAGCSRLRSLS
ncbi:MAG: DUF2127 domain-containing protein [Rhodanobacteraceae bacterium]